MRYNKKIHHFRIDRREGNRVGYWCGGCQKAMSCEDADRHCHFEDGSTFSSARCRQTGLEEIQSIYLDN